MGILETILLAFGGPLALIAVLGWLAKSFVTSLLDKDLEKFRMNLQAQHDSSIEKIRHELNLLAAQHQIRFAKLHAIRAEVIAELYSLLVEAHGKSIVFVSPGGYVGESTKGREASSAVLDFLHFFEKKKIYLPKDLGDLLDQYATDVNKHLIEYRTYVNHEPDHSTQEFEKKKNESWRKAMNAFEEAIPEAKEKLEDEFRKILG